MDDRFIRKARLGFYAAWAPMAALLVVLLAASGGLPWRAAFGLAVPLCALYALICRSSWHLSKVLPLSRASLASVLLTHLAAAFTASVLWVVAANGIGQALSAGGYFNVRIEPQTPLLLGVGVLYYLLAAAYHYLVLALQASREAERREVDARMLARESELKALKAQINPHFLFNALHSISALTSVDAARARQMCILLSDFLRSTLGLGEKESIRFGEELDLARKYVAVEQVRFGDRMEFHEHVEPDCLDCLVPPMLLQPLVENAVKHGVASLVEGSSVRLEARLSGGKLAITLENLFDPDAPSKFAGGVGLKIVKNRLRAGYGNSARMEAGAAGGSYRVELLLPQRKGSQG